MTKINRKTFFAAIKKIFPGGYGGKVGAARIEGIDLLLSEWEARDEVGVDDFAYIMATTVWETSYTMQPVMEYGGETYLRSKKYWPYVGMGYVQLTWEENYKKAGEKLGIDLLGNPNLAMVPEHAVKILFDGMIEGWFTGKSLNHYLDGEKETDAEDLKEFEGARRIVNGVDRKKEIAKLALTIDRALRAAEVVNTSPIEKSRTAGGAGVAAGGGAVVLIEPVQDVIKAVEGQQEAFNAGTVVSLVIGLIIVGGALYALYARWDDAGRPKFWQRGSNVKI